MSDTIEAEASTLEALKEAVTRQQQTITRLELILDQIPACVYWKDTHGVYIGQNQFSANNLLNHELSRSEDKGDIVGCTDFDIYSTDVAKQFREHDREVLENDRLYYKEEVLELENGEQYIQLSTKQPLKDSQGEMLGVIGNTVNISYLKKIEVQLRREKEKSETLSQEIKDEFMRNMEHDIRTPLNGIIGLVDHLMYSEPDPERRQTLSDIHLCTKELMNYYNAILDFARIEKGASPAISKKFSLRNLIQRIIQIETPAANNKQLELVLEWAEAVPDVVIGDDYRLYRILVNLVSNAIKFTNQGYVKLNINAVGQEDRQVVIQFIVKDTGIGIPTDKQNFIYEKFSRLDVADHSAERRGIGLGLRVVKQFMTELSGEVELESYPNAGSTFICSVPFELPLVGSLGELESE
jgi:two-component system, OmpR family, aerobic respiration control sensor histidine kinase ArcB